VDTDVRAAPKRLFEHVSERSINVNAGEMEDDDAGSGCMTSCPSVRHFDDETLRLQLRMRVERADQLIPDSLEDLKEQRFGLNK